MKKLVTLTVLLALGGGFFAARNGMLPPGRPGPVAGAARLAAEPMPVPSVEKLGRPELEKKIAEIDAGIERERLVERSNLGQLSAEELNDLRRRLSLRNRYFLRKLELDDGQG